MTKVCRKCNTNNLDEAKFCEKCGNKLPELTNESPSITDSGGIRVWWNKQNFIGRTLTILGLSCLGLILIVAIVGITSPDANNTPSPSINTTNVTTNSSPNITSSTSEEDKRLSIQNSNALKTSLNQFAADVYDEPGENPTVKNIQVSSVKSDNEIVLSFDVETTNAYGDKVTATYSGTWIKTNGIWKETRDLQRYGGYGP